MCSSEHVCDVYVYMYVIVAIFILQLLAMLFVGGATVGNIHVATNESKVL